MTEKNTKFRKNNIILYPSIKNEKDFFDIYCKLIWYFKSGFSNIGKIIISKKSTNLIIKIPSDLDSCIENFTSDFLRITTFCTQQQLESTICEENQAIILQWNNKEKINPKKSKNLKVFDVDDKRQRYATSNFLRASLEIAPKNESLVQTYQIRFRKLQQLKSEQSILLGTGPKLDEYHKFNFDKALVIACNSIVKNKEILEKTKPRIIVAADPVFHAGPSSYAEEFRKDLKSYIERNPDCHFISPFSHHHIYEDLFTENPHKNYLSIPIVQKDEINLSLIEDFRIEPTDNILTLLMLPIATNLSNKISLIGFDGNKSKPIFYFWKHNRESQYTKHLKGTKKTHSSFFKRSFSNYYKTHTHQTERTLDKIITKGKKIECLTASHIPALAKFNKSH